MIRPSCVPASVSALLLVVVGCGSDPDTREIRPDVPTTIELRLLDPEGVERRDEGAIFGVAPKGEGDGFLVIIEGGAADPQCRLDGDRLSVLVDGRWIDVGRFDVSRSLPVCTARLVDPIHVEQIPGYLGP